MKLIVGLGNPGKQYAGTLHNAGALVLDALAQKRGLMFSSAPKDIPAVVAKQGDTFYAKPTLHMNESGRAVQQLLSFYKLSPLDLVVVHDDIDLLMGDVRVDKDRGGGGHNGVYSIIEALGGEKSFTRVRVGVATKRTEQREGLKRDVAKIVLKKPGLLNRAAFGKTIEAGTEAVLHAIE